MKQYIVLLFNSNPCFFPMVFSIVNAVPIPHRSQNRLIEHNLRLVAHIIKKILFKLLRPRGSYFNRHNRAYKGINSFDYTKGTRLCDIRLTLYWKRNTHALSQSKKVGSGYFHERTYRYGFRGKSTDTLRYCLYRRYHLEKKSNFRANISTKWKTLPTER